MKIFTPSAPPLNNNDMKEELEQKIAELRDEAEHLEDIGNSFSGFVLRQEADRLQAKLDKLCK